MGTRAGARNQGARNQEQQPRIQGPEAGGPGGTGEGAGQLQWVMAVAGLMRESKVSVRARTLMTSSLSWVLKRIWPL